VKLATLNGIRSHSGQSYEDYLQRNIFEPAGMTNSGCSTPETRELNAIGGAHS
jgi:CubicO group peptidase (beta-lactamase class C family)